MRTIETEGILDYKVVWYDSYEIMERKDSKNYKTVVDGLDHLREPWIGVGVVQDGDLVSIESAIKLIEETNECINSNIPESQE